MINDAFNDAQLQALLEDLKDPDESVRVQATRALWQAWFQQKGALGLETLEIAQAHMDRNETEQAEALLSQLISDQPDFAEAWNRRAVLYYLCHRYGEAEEDCLAVVKLNPVHFGAWHGLGLCRAALGHYREAIQAFHRALEIQPYAIENKRLILECTARLS